MKIFKIALIFVSIISIACLAYAEIASAKGGEIRSGSVRPAGMKAERGIKNLLFGWTDIPRSIIEVTKESRNPLWGVLGGTVKGLGKALPRTVSGAADVLTFPIGDYNKMPVKPDELNTQIN